MQVESFAMASSWHNTWLGHAADFGIPLAVIAGFIYLSVIRRGMRLLRILPINSYTGTLSMYLLLNTVRRLVFSNVGGHSATEPFEFWWFYGLQIALFLHRPETAAKGSLENASRQPIHAGRRLSPLRPSPQLR